MSENINGGVLDPVADRVERTYVLVDANGKEIIGDDGKPIVVPEAEVQAEVGGAVVHLLVHLWLHGTRSILLACQVNGGGAHGEDGGALLTLWLV